LTVAAVWARLRSDLRSGWRAIAGLALLLGLCGGVVLGAAAGARRTESAFPRLLDAVRAFDATFETADLAEVEGLAQVGEHGRFASILVVPLSSTGRLEEKIGLAYASVDGGAFFRMERPKLLAGRLPNPELVNEALVNPALADRLDLSVGSTVPLRVLAKEVAEDDIASLQIGAPAPPGVGRDVTFTVVGVGVTRDDIVADERDQRVTRLLLTPAFFRSHVAGGAFVELTGVRLKGGPAAAPAFVAEVERRFRGRPAYEGGSAVISNTRVEMEARVQRAVRPYGVALALFAFLVAVASLLAIGQALARRLVLDAAENPTLRALGMTSSQLGVVALARAGLVAVGAAALAVAVAVPASTIMPIGPARLAEPTPGISVDGAVLGVGSVAIVVLVLAGAAVPAWLVGRVWAGAAVPAQRSGGRRSRTAELLSRVGFGSTSVTGVRMALEPGQGRTAVPVRSALVGAALAVAAVLAASTFAASLSRLISTPRLYGQDWDLAIDAGWGVLTPEQVVGVLGPDRSVAAFSAGIDAQVLVDGLSVPAVGLQDLKGSAAPSIVAGRPAATADEIVLGSRTLRRLHRAVGDVVTVGAGQDARPLRVVGRAVFPAIGRIEAASTGLGTGAALTREGLKAVAPGNPPIGFNLVLVRLAPGADRSVVQRRLGDEPRLRTPFEIFTGKVQVLANQRPTDIVAFHRVRSTPLLLAGLLVALTVMILGHTLVTAVRRRRRDLAVLKALGFLRWQISATVAWQASVLALLSVLAGLPIGLAAGRWAWHAFAQQLGVEAGPRLPMVAVALALPLALLVANLIAAVPAGAAARTHAALALRSE
jgi:putative ABC transport system permease protein